MAKVTINRQDSAPVPPIKSVTLELTPEEAQVLADIFDFVGGDPVHSRRKYTDSIQCAMRNAGIIPPHRVEDVKRDSMHGIRFTILTGGS